MTLSDRLSAAVAGSRELDAEMAVGLGWTTDYAESLAFVGNRTGKRWRNDERGFGWSQESGDTPPPYTTDLTAIVEEIERRGLEWSVSGVPPAIIAVGGRASAWVVAHASLRESDSEASTPALALCAALAKALGL